MAIKQNLALAAVLIGGLIIFKDKIGSTLSGAGMALGSSLSMGFEGFFSGLGSAFGLGGGGSSMQQMTGGSMQQMTGGGSMMQMMKNILIGNVDTTGNAGGLIPGKPIDNIDLTGGVSKSSTDIFRFISDLQAKIQTSPADVTLTQGSLNDIFKGAYDFLAKGGSSIENFLQSYKFPSGQTLEDVLGGGKGITPDAFGQVQKLMSMGLGIDMMIKLKNSVMNLVPFSMQSFMQMISAGSIGAGGGVIRSARPLTDIINQEGVTATQAANILEMTQPTPDFMKFMFGTNTGQAIAATYGRPTPINLMSEAERARVMEIMQYGGSYFGGSNFGAGSGFA